MRPQDYLLYKPIKKTFNKPIIKAFKKIFNKIFQQRPVIKTQIVGLGVIEDLMHTLMGHLKIFKKLSLFLDMENKFLII